MRTVVCDIETDSLDPTVIWCAVCIDYDTGEEFVFTDAYSFSIFANTVDRWVGHNFVAFDAPALNKIWDAGIKVDQIRDTLILSRLYNEAYEHLGKAKMKRTKHSLESWGERLGFPKLEFNDYSKYTPEMLEYCKVDTRLTKLVYDQLRKEGQGFSKFSVNLEHHICDILERQKRNGFRLDLQKAKTLLNQVEKEKQEIEESVHEDFPPKPKLIREYYPKLNKDGKTHSANTLGPLKDLYGFNYGGDPYSSIEWKPFNLRSSKDKLERLEPWWKPTIRTKTGKNWQVCEENLATISDDAPQSIKNLALYALLASRGDAIKSWIDNARRNGDSRVHGTVIHLAGWSGRMAHRDPNTGNIPGVHDKQGNVALYGAECRELWTVDKGNVLVGCDASAIQLRVLAHYINNPEYTKAVLGGVHDFNAKLLGVQKPVAKTFIYAWLLGASSPKIASILGCSVAQARAKTDQFINLTPGLKEFLLVKKSSADRGWFRGLDGRKVYVPNDHLSLTGYLQNGEGVVMRLANVYWQKWADERGINYKQCAIVHDEFQVECEEDRAEELATLMERSFEIAGRKLKMNVPLAGEAKIGLTWKDTH